MYYKQVTFHIHGNTSLYAVFMKLGRLGNAQSNQIH